MLLDTAGLPALTLSTNPGSLRWLIDCPRLAAASGKLRRSSRTVRFDTPDLRLYRHGIELCVRQEGNRFFQSVAHGAATTNGTAPGFAATSVGRVREFESADAEPRLNRFDTETLRPLIDLDCESELAPVLAWRVARQTRILQEAGRDGGTEIFEIAFDEGEIETPGVPIPIAELALTILKGPPDAPYRLARELQQSVPLTIEPRSRFERGLPRIAELPPRWHKARRPSCTPGATVDSAVAAIFRDCIEHFLVNEAAALDGRDPEGVHQVRVALRRMRSAWSTFAPLLATEDSASLRAEAKWLAGNLGPARDWDVFLTERLMPMEARYPGNAALAVLRRSAEAARRAAYHQASSALLSQRATRLFLDFGEWIETRGWRGRGPAADDESIAPAMCDRPLADMAPALLERQYRKVCRRGRHFARLPGDARHELRLAVKKLRYTAEFFVQLAHPATAKKFVTETAALQDALGNLTDATTLAARLDAMQATAPDDTLLARAAGVMIGAADAQIAATGEAAVRDAWRGFKRCTPFWDRSVA